MAGRHDEHAHNEEPGATGGHDHAGHDHADDGHDHAGHDHDHHHGLGGHHHPPPKDFGKAFILGIGLNTAFVAIEAVFGLLAGSMALLADAGHNASDVIGLLIAWVAIRLARRPPNERYTYGLGGSSILAALANAVLLLVAVGAIAWEAVERFWTPQPVAGVTVMIVAGVGIAINGFTAWLFASGSKDDINVKGAYLHMAADAAVSAGVVIAGLVMMLTGWTWIDPVTSLAIVVLIVWGTWGLLRDSVGLALGAVPPGIEPARVRAALQGLPGVTAIHDLHIWAMSTTETAMTCHLVMPEGHPGDDFLAVASQRLTEKFGIGHATLQIETGSLPCPLAPDHVV